MATRQKRKEKITRERQKQILDAALTVFSSRGFGESTVADIAAAAGIGVGTIYNYYKDKQDVLISLIAHTLLSVKFVKILGNAPAGNSEELIQSLFEERLSFGLDNVHKILFLFFEIQREPKLRQQYVTQVVGPLLTRIEKYLLDQVEEGHFRKMDARVISRTLAASIIGNMILYRLEGRDSPFKKSRIKETAEELRKLFIYGLAAR
ncbi:MAG: TetR/AcrR family transcriptional regulator [Dehalococcoidia bacterium]|nr:TetR/AcrR family transcriptional regulator [Dehalococcoidia bacterium]